MNELIKELANKAVGKRSCYMIESEYIKFAELIVRECARVYWNIDNGETHTEYVEALKQHFGVEE